MIDYDATQGAKVDLTLELPQDVLDDVVVGTVNPAFETLLDNCGALYFSAAMSAVRNAKFVAGGIVNTDNILGWGAAVGTIYAGGLGISAKLPAGVTGAAYLFYSLHTLAVAENVHSAFAQSADGMTVIGTGATSAQTVWRSANGGVTWSEIALPGTVNTASDVLVYHDPYSGDWYIARMNAGGLSTRLYRSTDDGLTWSARIATNSIVNTVNSVVLAAEPGGRLWIKTRFSTGANSVTLYSDDQGLTFTNAALTADYYANTIVTWNGRVYALGANPTLGRRFIGYHDGASWTIFLVHDTFGLEAFTRFATTVGPLLVTTALATSAATDLSGLIVFRSHTDYSYLGPVGNSTDAKIKAYQAPSPGGVHVMPFITNTDVLSITFEER